MSVPAYTTDLVPLDDAADGTGWGEPTATGWTAVKLTAYGDADDPIEGTACNSASLNAGVGGLLFDGAGFTLPEDGAVLLWAKFDASASLATYSSGGVRVVIGSALNAFYWSNVAGSDTFPYGMGWQRLAMGDPAQVPCSPVGSPTDTRRYVGWCYSAASVPSKGNAYKVDSLSYGRCEARFSAGEEANPCTFSGYASTDGVSTNKWGLLWPTSGGLLWHGLITIGYGGPAYMVVANQQVFIAADQKVPKRFNRIVIQDAATQCYWDGLIIMNLGSASRGDLEVDLDDDPVHEETSCQFRGMGGFWYAPGSSIESCTWADCLTVWPRGAALAYCRFESSASVWAALCVDSASSMALVTGGVFKSCPCGIALRGTDDTFSFSGIGFDGCGYDLVNETGAICSEWGPDCQTGWQSMYSSSTVRAVGQSFAGDGSDIKYAVARLKKTGSPGGTVTAKLYAGSGTFGGGDDIPTGSPLATSGPINAADLGTAGAQVVFTFASAFSTTPGAHYVIVFEPSAGSAGNTVDVGFDGFNPGHAGNLSTFNGSAWTADAGRDLVHVVRGASLHIIINASGSSVSTYLTPYGGSVTIVPDQVSVTFEGDPVGLIGAEVRIYDYNGTGNSLGDELDGTESCPTETFTFTGEAANTIWVQVLLAGFEEVGFELVMPSANLTYTISLTPDTNA